MSVGRGGVGLGLRLATCLAGLIGLAGLTACSASDGSTRVHVVVDGRGLTPGDQAMVKVVCVFVDGDSDGGQIKEVFSISGLKDGQYSFDYHPKTTGLITVTVVVKDVNGNPLATSTTTVEVIKGKEVPAVVTLGSSGLDGGPDATTADASAACNATACSGTVSDGCCPGSCSATTDVDCAGCGNGRVDPGETCDPMSTCPTSCPQVACEQFSLQNAGTCQAACVSSGFQTVCVNGDSCCPSGCNSSNDSDCAVRCGNGVREGSELCDGDCPTSCEALGCQLRTLAGSAATCDAHCVNGAMQTTCVGGDGCCPAGCNSSNDSDCALRCGNGILESGELCDGNCPTTCPAMGCQLRTLTGSASTCDAQCVNGALQTACVNGDGCCPSGCNANTDTDCHPSCGNGIVEAGETCDPAAACTALQTACVADANTIVTTSGSVAACSFACSRVQRTCGPADGLCPTNVACGPTTDVDCPGCGNGRIEAGLGETCDPPSLCMTQQTACVSDANTIRTPSGSVAACTFKCTAVARTCGPADGFCPAGCGPTMDVDCPGCGNGRIESGETCDVAPAATTCASITCNDGNACTNDVRNGSNAACNVTCTHTPIVACVGGDGCCPAGCNAVNDPDCGAVCGNGIKEGAETCEVAPASPLCTSITCNDGNACTTDVRNGSNAACNVTCSNTAITTCVNGDGCCPGGGLGACNANNDTDCAPRCGNGVKESGETCDSAPASPTCASITCDDMDACTADVRNGADASCNVTCTHTPIVACKAVSDGCCPAGCNANNDADCAPVCGNGVIESGETCDPLSSCPTSCAQQQCHLPDLLNGGTCAAKCVDQGRLQTSCVDGDGCCPTGCTDLDDSNCPTPNDLCANATNITAGGDFPFSLLTAKQELAAATCDPTGGPEVFFTFTVTNTSLVYLDVLDPAGKKVDVGLEVYFGGCPAAGTQPVLCDVANGMKTCNTANPWPMIFDSALIKGNYVVVARALNGVRGRYTLRYQHVPVTCVNAGAMGTLNDSNTCGGAPLPVDLYAPTCATSGEDKTYYLAKCPATGLSVNTCSARTSINTVLQVNQATVDLVAGKCVVTTGMPVTPIACNNDAACAATMNSGTSTLTNIARGERGIFTVTVDTFSTTKCGAFELNSAVLP